jgi:hypothetical protein
LTWQSAMWVYSLWFHPETMLTPKWPGAVSSIATDIRARIAGGSQRGHRRFPSHRIRLAGLVSRLFGLCATLWTETPRSKPHCSVS